MRPPATASASAPAPRNPTLPKPVPTRTLPLRALRATGGRPLPAPVPGLPGMSRPGPSHRAARAAGPPVYPNGDGWRKRGRDAFDVGRHHYPHAGACAGLWTPPIACNRAHHCKPADSDLSRASSARGRDPPRDRQEENEGEAAKCPSRQAEERSAVRGAAGATPARDACCPAESRALGMAAAAGGAGMAGSGQPVSAGARRREACSGALRRR